MFNYRITFKADVYANIVKIDTTFKTLAERSVTVGAELKALEEAVQTAIKADDLDAVKSAQTALDKKADAWKAERKGYNNILFGNKKENMGGLCDGITKTFYESYVDFVEKGNLVGLKDTVRNYLIDSIEESDVKDRAVNEFTTALICQIGGKFASNKKIVEGSKYIVAMNKNAFKKYFFGALLDIIVTTTIKVAETAKTEA